MSLWSIALSGMIYLLRKIFFWVFLLENRKMREVILETERLVLRTLEQDDFEEVCKLLQDPVVMYAYEGAFSDQEVQAWLDKMFWRYENDGFAL